MSHAHEQKEARQERSQAQALVLLAETLPHFRTPEGLAYVTLPTGEHCPARSQRVRSWLTVQYHAQTGGVPNKNAMESALSFLEAYADMSCDEAEVHLRVAWHEGKLYLDLIPEVVCVTAKGWFILEGNCPVRFRRARGQLPLPHPTRDGTLDDLRAFLNPGLKDDGWALIKGWLLGCLLPEGAMPLLVLSGEKGSAKSTATRFLRVSVDPAVADAAVQPKDNDALTLKGHHNWVVAFDNMSSMPRWLSDGLCRLSTGAADSKRAHYENTEEILFKHRRPAVINGIEQLATAGDVLDRAVIVEFPAMDGAQRASERDLNTRFEAARPALLGALLDASVRALANRGNVHLGEDAPRMIDWATWVVAAEGRSFLEAYTHNRAEATAQEVEASPLAAAVV